MKNQKGNVDTSADIKLKEAEFKIAPRKSRAKLRLLSGMLPAAVMTFGLFTFMYASIGEFDVPEEPEALPELTKITPDIKTPEPPTPKPPIEFVSAVEPPPSPEPYRARDVKEFIPVPKEFGSAPVRIDRGKLLPTDLITVDTSKQLQAITAPNVVYPPRMLDREIEGSCEVRFDVSARGEPFNIDADCSHSGFEASAKRAVAGARFSPKVADGKPVERLNVVYPIHYSMDF